MLSRVTLVGERRRVDMVLPAREPVGILLPEMMRLLDGHVKGRPASRHLVTVDGSALDHDSTLESAGVRDGAVLRLARAEDAPPAPVVHDLSDEVAQDLGHRTALHYPLGDGSDPSALVALRHLAAHLRTGVPRTDG
ncbi:hypothetical protein GCM10018789_07660 [Streptomyces werraensis]|nr:hypothetical protein GCM10018789_07660 [Streptomyces werraensis]